MQSFGQRIIAGVAVSVLLVGAAIAIGAPIFGSTPDAPAVADETVFFIQDDYAASCLGFGRSDATLRKWMSDNNPFEKDRKISFFRDGSINIYRYTSNYNGVPKTIILVNDAEYCVQRRGFYQTDIRNHDWSHKAFQMNGDGQVVSLTRAYS